MLAARDLWVVPPGTREAAVRGVSLGLGDGEWLAVTGPNGCGKSSLALALAGLWPASRGAVEVDGAALEPTPAGRAAARIAAVLQEPASQLFEATVADEIAFTPRNLGVAEDEVRRRVERWSARFEVGDLLDWDPRALSAGHQQRVLLAAALASEPRILVVDEGTAHLDAPARRLAMEVLGRERSDGLSVLTVTQDPWELDAADRVLHLQTMTPMARLSFSAWDGASRSRAEGAGEPSHCGTGLSVWIDPDPNGQWPRIVTGRRLEFRIEPTRPVALMGPNGSGKSVTLETIAGARASPQVGVLWDKTPTLSPVLVAQYPELQLFGDTVLEEIRFGIRQRGANPEWGLARASEWLAALGLPDQFLHRSPWALSVGERRLVQVIAALVTPAPAMLLDEPTCGIDPTRSARLAEILTYISRTTSLAVATQDTAFVSRIAAQEVYFADRLALAKSQ